jgi:hypothetical protein
MVAVVLAVPVVFATGANGKPAGRAAVVVQHGNLGTLTDCVPLTQKSVDGVKLLAKSHFDFRVAKYNDGTALCWLDGEGCKTTSTKDCFCTPAKGVTGAWQYWVQDKGDSLWRFSSTYPSGRKVSDGSIDYWTFGPYGTPPDDVGSFDDVCGK